MLSVDIWTLQCLEIVFGTVSNDVLKINLKSLTNLDYDNSVNTSDLLLKIFFRKIFTPKILLKFS